MCLRRAIALILTAAVAGGSQTLADLVTPVPLPANHTLILGFLGSWESWDDKNRGVRKLALKLRGDSLPDVHVETFGNRRRHVALEFILRALDANRNGAVDPEERTRLRIVLYGQSLGGLAVVKLARELNEMEIPVRLTVQIDSVGLTDGTIPVNVVAAANLHQQSLFSIRGRKSIRAADPARTRILENLQYYYSIRKAGRQPESWARRMLGGGHVQMEADPAVWEHVETLILKSLKGLQ